MKTTIKIFVMGLLIGVIAIATTLKEMAPVSRIGYASAKAILQNLPEAKLAAAKLDSLRKEYTEQFRLKVDEYRTKTSTLEQARGLSELVRRDREQEFRTLQASITRFQQSADSAYKADEQRLMQPINTRVQSAIREVASQYNYTHIINVDAGTTSFMLYGDKHTNTDSLILLKLKMK